MRERLQLIVDAHIVSVEIGTTVAAAIAQAGLGITRHSVNGSLRAPLCGMGVCQECRVTINDLPHQLACQTPCTEGMRIRTAAAKEVP